MDRTDELLQEHDITLTLTDEARNQLAEEGYDPDFGARPLRRVIQSKVEDALSEGILAGDFLPGDTIQADAKDGEIVFEVLHRAEEPTEPLPEIA